MGDAAIRERRLAWWNERYPRARWLGAQLTPTTVDVRSHELIWQWVRELCADPLRASYASEARALELWLRVGAGVALSGIPLRRPRPPRRLAAASAAEAPAVEENAAEPVVVPFMAGGAQLAALACVLLAYKYEEDHCSTYVRCCESATYARCGRATPDADGNVDEALIFVIDERPLVDGGKGASKMSRLVCVCGEAGCAHRLVVAPVDLLAECMPWLGASGAAPMKPREQHALAAHMLRCAEHAVLDACTWRLDAPTMSEYAWSAVLRSHGDEPPPPQRKSQEDMNAEAWIIYLWCADHCFDAASLRAPSPEHVVARAIIESAPAAAAAFPIIGDASAEQQQQETKRQAIVIAAVA